MGIIKKLKSKTVFLDTAPLIYYIEENRNYSPILNKLFQSNSKGDFLFQTSVITLLEVLVHPMRENEQQLVEEYQNILCNSPSIDIIDITIDIAIKAAGLRAKYGLKTPDSIQVATALNASAQYFLTNDIRLKVISEIEVLILDEIVKE
jgi:predicted nucleic acid-binding protein